VLDVLAPEIHLKRARVVPLGGQRETAGMPQRVRMSFEAELRTPLAHARLAHLHFLVVSYQGNSRGLGPLL
jgi:hypothetical protein